MPFYLAYGSNMWKGQMFSRCPQAQPVRRINLPNRRLIFRRYADLESAAGASVPCALYKVTRSCLERLDWFEGVRAGAYYRHTLRISTPDLGVISAVTYLNGRAYMAPPTDEYVERLRKGYRDWKVKPERLDNAVRAAGYLPPEERPKAPPVPAMPKIDWTRTGVSNSGTTAERAWDTGNEGWYDYGQAWKPARQLHEEVEGAEEEDPYGSLDFWRSYRSIK